jgi:hypothetical protein
MEAEGSIYSLRTVQNDLRSVRIQPSSLGALQMSVRGVRKRFT